MQKKFLRVQGIDLAYGEKNPSASHSIIFIHGNSVSARSWRKQWEDPLLEPYRLLAIELPAHGDSGVADDPATAYTLPALGQLLALAVRELTGDKPFLLAGVSLATNVMAEMLPHGIGAAGLLLAGPCVVGAEVPLEKLVKPGTHVSVVFMDEAGDEEVQQYGRETSLARGEDQQIFLEDYYQVAAPFRSALGQSIAAGQYSDQVALLREAGLPLLVIFGADEQVIDPDYLDEVALPIWKDRIVKIPGASHLVNIDQPEAFNQQLAGFAREVFKSAGV